MLYFKIIISNSSTSNVKEGRLEFDVYYNTEDETGLGLRSGIWPICWDGQIEESYLGKKGWWSDGWILEKGNTK